MKYPKFIQIISHQGELYALDALGDIWRRDIRQNGDAVWAKQIGRDNG